MKRNEHYSSRSKDFWLSIRYDIVESWPERVKKYSLYASYRQFHEALWGVAKTEPYRHPHDPRKEELDLGGGDGGRIRLDGRVGHGKRPRLCLPRHGRLARSMARRWRHHPGHGPRKAGMAERRESTEMRKVSVEGRCVRASSVFSEIDGSGRFESSSWRAGRVCGRVCGAWIYTAQPGSISPQGVRLRNLHHHRGPLMGSPEDSKISALFTKPLPA